MADLKEEVAELTEEERELYDRQIRLWGAEAQQRMLRARVLVIGADGLALEVCKNLVLSGIGQLTVLDSELVIGTDLGAQYYLREDDIGKNRAQCCTKRLAALNHNVAITADSASLESKPDDFYKGFDTVCVVGQTLAVQIYINRLCRSSNTNFFSADVFGFAGFFFADLIEHDYITTTKDKNDVTIKKKQHKSCVSLAECLSAPWAAFKRTYRKHKDELAVFFAIQVLYTYEFQNGFYPDDSNENEMKDLLSIRDKELKNHDLDSSFLPDEVIRKVAHGAGIDICPTCAFVGGYLAQEILKSTFGFEAPIPNVFVGNGSKGIAMEISPKPKPKTVKKLPTEILEVEDSDTEPIEL